MSPTPDWPSILAQLSEPFPAEGIHWRVGSVSHDKKTAQALPYADSRAYEDRLNNVCPNAWTVTYHPWGDTRIICNLTIHNLTRSSTGEQGTSPNDIAGTSAEAQAFKRACSKYGLGRYLYDLPTPWLPYDPNTKRFLKSPTIPTATTAHHAVPRTVNVIGPERAAAMSQKLRAHGLTGRQQHALAARVLRKAVTDLSTLTEEEARIVWNEAQRHRAHRSQQVGQPAERVA